MEISPRIKVWLSTAHSKGVFGDGRWRLLRAIEKESCLKSAAFKLNISYRKAWGDLKKSEECLGIVFTDKQRGGSSGGATKLTKKGKQIVAAYTQFRAEIKRAVKRAFDMHLSKYLKIEE